MQSNVEKTVEKSRQALLAAIARGRPFPTSPPPVRSAKQPTPPPVLAVLEGLQVEELEYCADPDAQSPSQSWVPLRVVSDPAFVGGNAPRPCAILLHPGHNSKDIMAKLQAKYAGRGYVAVAIDARYHGVREDPELHYQDALVRAWKDGIERPFLLDTVWDLIRLLDYLETREDVDTQRIGVTGYSLGGMHSWFLAAADTRIAAAAPMGGVQNFSYALENNLYQPRVDSIIKVFQAAAADAGADAITKEVVQSVWQRLLPGMLDSYDAPASLSATAPRPLLVITGEEDPRCPLPGLMIAVEQAREVYASLGAPEALEFYAQSGNGHGELTAEQLLKLREFMDRMLLIK